MKKLPRNRFAVLIFAVAAAVAWSLFHEPAEVYHDGRPLSFWLEGYNPETETGSSQEKADQAMGVAGTNAIPTLLRLLQAKDSHLKLKWYSVLDWMDKNYAYKIEHSLAWERNYEGWMGFKNLGDIGKAAVPDLIKIYDRNISVESRQAAVYSLGAIGPSAKNAVPALLKWLATDPKETAIEATILQALGEIHSDPDLAVPILTDYLGDSHYLCRQCAAKALGAFDTQAKRAMPALFDALKDPEESVRRAARNALIKIDPKATAKAEVK